MSDAPAASLLPPRRSSTPAGQPHVAAIIGVEREVFTRSSKTGLLRHSAETAFYISNMQLTAARLRSFACNILKANRIGTLTQDRYRPHSGDSTTCSHCWLSHSIEQT
jgi:hypothetical protein